MDIRYVNLLLQSKGCKEIYDIIFISIIEQIYATFTYTAPTGPTIIDPDSVTAAAHRDATPLPEMHGADTVYGFGMINSGVVISNK